MVIILNEKKFDRSEMNQIVFEKILLLSMRVRKENKFEKFVGRKSRSMQILGRECRNLSMRGQTNKFIKRFFENI